jgi:predicted nucleotidyltransferase
VNLSAPLTDVSPSLHGAVLTVLAEASTYGQALSGRRIAARIRDRGSQEGVRRVLEALVEAGLVRREDQPPAVLYTLNTDHLAVPHLLAIHHLRDELFNRMRAEIANWEIQPVSAVIFGSVARNDSHVGSDIDLLLVREPDVPYVGLWSTQFGDLMTKVSQWTGSYIGLIDYTPDKWQRGLDIFDPLIDEIEKDGITLAGLTPRELRARLTQGGRVAA